MSMQDLENIVNKIMIAYKDDFYKYDVDTLNKPNERYYLWIVRKTGTHLIPKSSVARSETLAYWLENSNNNANNYYEIDTSDMTVMKIPNIENYYNLCNIEVQFTNVIQHNNSELDMDYDY